MAQAAAGALGVTAAVRAMETPAALREAPAQPRTLHLPRPQDQAQALAAAAFRPGSAPDRDREEAPRFEVRPPETDEELGQLELKATKVAYTRRF